ncbi:homoprotocatechuate degradation operon regulator HpaR [Noviherbaspirillum sp.]|uniref:homoprotocatechuate degradation operon regulator HpaR n=1 Tax=Noviherbaspirillum sp. TaxID=1926288 RepID=UPI0025CD532E|nr:homoprotocatechuate degradation operon regulator HpaR [Noviherbaspirillum sp.]
MKHRITYRNLPQLFLKARECLMSHFRPILNHFGVTEQQWRILRMLDERGQLEPRELCDLCQIQSPSMAGVLARMEDMGLVRRARLPEDQRRVMVRLAPKGDRLIAEIAPLIDAQYDEIEKTFGKLAINALFASLEAFIEANESPVPAVELPSAGERRKAGRRSEKS